MRATPLNMTGIAAVIPSLPRDLGYARRAPLRIRGGPAVSAISIEAPFGVYCRRG